MYKKTITYTDYDGNERTEDFYFNLNKAELMEMQLSEEGGYEKMLERIIAEQDTRKIIDIFKDIIKKSYGQKSLDGRKFVKNQEVLDDFMASAAYPELFMELASNEQEAAKFVQGIMPDGFANNVALEQAKNIPAPALKSV